MTVTTTTLGTVEHGDRRGSRDRLELLTALLNARGVEPFFRNDVICYPDQHRVFAWRCSVASCDSPRTGHKDMCHQHIADWAQLKAEGGSRFELARTASPRASTVIIEPVLCRICRHRPTSRHSKELCIRHDGRWHAWLRAGGSKADLERWTSDEVAYPTHGQCKVAVCSSLAANPLKLCADHRRAYDRVGQPGAAILLPGWNQLEQSGRQTVAYADESAFRRWCSTTEAIPRPGQTNLRGLPPLVATEIRYGLLAHTQRETHTIWDLRWVQLVADAARASGVRSLIADDIGVEDVHGCNMVLREMRRELQLAYFTPAETKEAGYIESEHFGVRFENRFSNFDLTGVSQRWLRDLLWDYMAGMFRSPQGPRSTTPVDAARRGCIELGAFLEITAVGGGHDPRLLTQDDALRFVADQAHRARANLPSVGIHRVKDKQPGTVTENTKRVVFNACR